MPKLTKYTSFESLKTTAQPAVALSVEEKKRLEEFERFLKMLQDSFSVKKNLKADYGK